MKQIKNNDETRMVSIPSGAVQVENDITLLQKKLWYELVYNAIPLMKTQRVFTIKLEELMEKIGWKDSKNYALLKSSLKGLIEKSVEWNIFDRDNNDWESFSMLAGCTLKEKSGICKYDFSYFLQKKFLDMGEVFYTKLDLMISHKFQSKYALSIYSLALDYLILDKNYGEKILKVDELRKFLGIKSDDYKLFGDFNRRILKTAEKEINEISDMKIEIIPEKGKSSKKISQIRIKMKLDKDRINVYKSNKVIIQEKKQMFLPISDNVYQENNFLTEKPDLVSVSNEKLQEFYADNGISLSPKTIQNKLRELKENLGESFENYLIFLMEYTKREEKKSGIKSISGFYIGLLKDDLQVSNYKVLNQKDIQKKEESKEKLNIILEEKLKKKYTSEMFEDFTNYLLMNQDNLEEKITELLNENLRDKNQFVYDMLIKQFGELDIRALTKSSFAIKSAVVGFLKNYKEELEYPETSFEYWRNQIIDEKDIMKLREEIERGLRG